MIIRCGFVEGREGKGDSLCLFLPPSLSVWSDPARGPVLYGGCTAGLLGADTWNLSRCFGAGRGLSGGG